ncbi:MAG: hypothetical protein RR977_05270 [Oscillospiraceae bacterium]
MKKIGLIDYYLDEWHANHLPEWIHDESKGTYEIAYAYGKIKAPEGRSSLEWCEDHQIDCCSSIEEVIEKSDVLMVLAPDNPETHWELCALPLRSGKPTYVDKTFAPDYQTAVSLVKLAKEYHTPMFSSSALRFSKEFEGIEKKGIRTVSTTGAGVLSNYAIHQLEMIVYLMGADAKRVMFLGTEDCPQLVIDFSGNRSAMMGQFGWDCPFSVNAARDDGTFLNIRECSSYFERFIQTLIPFFETGEEPIHTEETLMIAALREYGMRAASTHGVWVDLP